MSCPANSSFNVSHCNVAASVPGFAGIPGPLVRTNPSHISCAVEDTTTPSAIYSLSCKFAKQRS